MRWVLERWKFGELEVEDKRGMKIGQAVKSASISRDRDIKPGAAVAAVNMSACC